jgi:hypothetical protein
MKELQGKDNVSADIADYNKAFSAGVHLGLNRIILSTLNTAIFTISSFKHFIVRYFKFDKAVPDIKQNTTLLGQDPFRLHAKRI